MLLKKENGWKNKDLEREKIFDFCQEYKTSLDLGKTEREYVRFGLELAKKNGFVCANSKERLEAGDKVYYVNREKNLVLVVVGKEDIKKGINYVVSHIDSPRIDLKQNPLYVEL